MHNGVYSTKYHFLGGPPQWEYCRFLAVKSGLISDEGVICSAVGGAGTSASSDTTSSSTTITNTSTGCCHRCALHTSSARTIPAHAGVYL